MRIELAMQRQDQRAIFGDLQRLRRHAYALLLDLGNFVEEMVRIEHHAIADDRKLARPHDARGQQRQFVDLAVDDQRVPGIVAALEAHDDIGLDRQPVDDLAFSFIAPLGADDDNIGHAEASLSKAAQNVADRQNGPKTARRQGKPRHEAGGHWRSGLANCGRRVKRAAVPALTCIRSPGSGWCSLIIA